MSESAGARAQRRSLSAAGAPPAGPSPVPGASTQLSTAAVLLIIAGALLAAVGCLFFLRISAIRRRELALQARGAPFPPDDPEYGPFGLATPPEKREAAAAALQSRLEALRAEAAAAERAERDDSPNRPAFFYPKVLEGGQWKEAVNFKPPASQPLAHGAAPRVETVHLGDIGRLQPAPRAPARSPLAPRPASHAATPAAAWQTPASTFPDSSAFGTPFQPYR